MEHKIVQGGEQWLPLARSRIKAMRAAGLTYATQQFEIDGCSIRVRIEPGQDYIHINGGEIKLLMDSGVVGLNATAGPDGNKPGTLYESDHVAAYNAAFAPIPESTRWRRKTGTTGQLSGHVTYSASATTANGHFKGKVPFDGQNAESFMATFTEDMTVDPPVWKLNESDNHVSAKKQVAIACPASIFTGKCRLYVQAMYGRPLYIPTENESGVAHAPKQEIPFNLAAAVGATGIPGLQITPYRHDKDDPDEVVTPVNLTTSSGVYLNTTTGEHWLITIFQTWAECYHLLPEKPLQKLRKYLKADDTTLDTADKEHLEAYLLATCLPSHVDSRTFDVNTTFASGASALIDSTAYGWHWNWSGTAADIVTTRDAYHSWTSGGDMLKQQSTHARITPVFDETGPISASVTVLQANGEWILSRRFHIIMKPDWATLGNRKLNSYIFDTSAAFAYDDVVFYAFYKRDELVTCKVSLLIGTEAAESIGPLKAGGDFQFSGGHPCFTEGGESGWVEDIGTGSYIAAQFKCGGVETPKLPTGMLRLVGHQEVANSRQGPFSTVMYTTSPFESATVVMPDGSSVFCEPALGRYYYKTTTFNYSTWDWITWAETRTYYGVGVVSIPFNDAEAIISKHVLYHEGDKTITTHHLTADGPTTAHWVQVYIKTVQYTPVYGWAGGVWSVVEWLGPTVTETSQEFTSATFGQGGGAYGVPYLTGANRIIEPNVHIPYTLTIQEDITKIVVRSGTVPASLDLTLYPSIMTPELSEAGTPFSVKTGIAEEGAVVLSNLITDGVQGAPTGIVNPVIVGWA